MKDEKEEIRKGRTKRVEIKMVMRKKKRMIKIKKSTKRTRRRKKCRPEGQQEKHPLEPQQIKEHLLVVEGEGDEEEHLESPHPNPSESYVYDDNLIVLSRNPGIKRGPTGIRKRGRPRKVVSQKKLLLRKR
jgi:hypothetical protein